jgi:hypothetical protein
MNKKQVKSITAKQITVELDRAAKDVYLAYDRLNALTKRMVQAGLHADEVDSAMVDLDNCGININEMADLSRKAE